MGGPRPISKSISFPSHNDKGAHFHPERKAFRVDQSLLERQSFYFISLPRPSRPPHFLCTISHFLPSLPSSSLSLILLPSCFILPFFFCAISLPCLVIFPHLIYSSSTFSPSFSSSSAFLSSFCSIQS